MSRRSLPSRIKRALGELLGQRGFDAASWKRFPREARMGRMSGETLRALQPSRSKARYFHANEGLIQAAVSALTTYGFGTGSLPAHEDSAAVEAFTSAFWANCDADGRLDFGGLGALAFLEVIVAGEVFVQFLPTADGLKIRLIPAEQVAEDVTRELSGGGRIQAGIEFDARGRIVAYHVHPFLPSAQFETWAPPVRVLAADMLHVFRPMAVGQSRGLTWLAPIMLKLADLGILNDALLKGYQVAALHAGWLTDLNGSADFPYDGSQEGSVLVSGMEPGTLKRLPPGMDVKFSSPQAAQDSVEYLRTVVEAIAAGLGVPAYMVNGDVSRANYSSLRAALTTFKASLETIQFNMLVPQLLAPIWRRWALHEQLSGRMTDDIGDCEWRFPALPEADPLKQVQATAALLDKRLMSRAEAIAQRGESIERVDADWAADSFAAEQAAALALEESPDDDA